MKSAILVVIELYWNFFPASYKRECLYKESCSKFVYRVTKESGSIAGIRAYIKRYKSCTSEYCLSETGIQTGDKTIVLMKDANPFILEGLHFQNLKK